MITLLAIILVTFSVLQCILLFIKYKADPILEKALLWEGSIVQLIVVIMIILIVRENIVFPIPL